MSSRNVHPVGDNTNAKASPLPGSVSVPVRDLDDVRDVMHGGFRSPKLDSRRGHGSIGSASFATGAVIILALAGLAFLGWLSNQRVNRPEVPEQVLTATTCNNSPDGIRFSAQYNHNFARTVPELDDAAGLEVEVTLVDLSQSPGGAEVATKTVWLDFEGQRAISTNFGDVDVTAPECLVNVFAA